MNVLIHHFKKTRLRLCKGFLKLKNMYKSSKKCENLCKNHKNKRFRTFLNNYRVGYKQTTVRLICRLPTIQNVFTAVCKASVRLVHAYCNTRVQCIRASHVASANTTLNCMGLLRPAWQRSVCLTLHPLSHQHDIYTTNSLGSQDWQNM